MIKGSLYLIPNSLGVSSISNIAEAQKNGLTCAFVDAEHAFDPLYAKNLGIDLEELINAKQEDSTNTFVEECLRDWNMPDSYLSINIHEWLMERCTTAQQRDRVYTELLEYEKRGMIIVLKFLLYLVETCDKNDIVLGVGRGSSVASYCLYLLGIHCVDSIKYELDIKEFLK